jgi:flagellar biosynthetic protein FlhB
MAGQDLDQTEDATPHKLDDARKKGSVAKSTDFISLAMLAALAVALFASGWDMLRHTLRLQRRILGHAGAGAAGFGSDAVAQWLGTLLAAMLNVLSPLFLCLLVVAVLANLFQTGPVFSFHPITPDLERLSPMAGIKRILSLRTLYESGKSVLKLVLLGMILYSAVRAAVPGLAGLGTADPRLYPGVLLGLAGGLLLKMLAALLVVALIDLLFVRWEFGKRMRMSKREVKDETKNREGDPRIRARIRDLRRELLKRSQALGKVPEADVLITNPTRIAIALRYEHGKSGAPQVLAKGAGELARAMRELASRHQIPVVQNRALARGLFREVEFDGYVPEKWYPQVARIMVWVFALRKMKR